MVWYIHTYLLTYLHTFFLLARATRLAGWLAGCLAGRLVDIRVTGTETGTGTIVADGMNSSTLSGLQEVPNRPAGSGDRFCLCLSVYPLPFFSTKRIRRRFVRTGEWNS